MEDYDTKNYPTLDRIVRNMKLDAQNKWWRQNRMLSYMHEIKQNILGLSTATPIFFGSGNLLRLLIMLRDLTGSSISIQDGGHKTGSDDISAYRHVSNKIPTATRMFQGSSIQMRL